MNITLFPNDMPPYYTGRSPNPDELDEFVGWTPRKLIANLIRQGKLDAKFTGGSWRVLLNADGTYSGELYEWRHRRDEPQPTSFDSVSLEVAADVAYRWAYATAG